MRDEIVPSARWEGQGMGHVKNWAGIVENCALRGAGPTKAPCLE
jgi:hypothetical protein